MKKTATLLIFICILLSISNLLYADPGLSSIEAVVWVYGILGLIILTLGIFGIIWFRITLKYLFSEAKGIYQIKRYIFISILLIGLSGISAFTFHQNAPYSQNTYFLIASSFFVLGSVLSICVRLFKSRNT